MPPKKFPFASGVSVYLLAYLRATSALRQQIEDIRAQNGVAGPHQPHVTLHALALNADHPAVDDVLEALADSLHFCYANSLEGVEGETRSLEVIGGPVRFLVVGFAEAPFTEVITKFRTCLYAAIERRVGRLQRGAGALPNFRYYSDARGPVYAVQDIYAGQDKWKPHVTICRLPVDRLCFPGDVLQQMLGGQPLSLHHDVEKLVLSPSGARSALVEVEL